MLKHKVILLIALLQMASHAYADRMGNGGTSWVCWNEDESDILWLEQTDLWELEHVHKLEQQSFPIDSDYHQVLARVRQRLALANPLLYRQMSPHFDYVVSHIEQTQNALPYIEDANYTLLPAKREFCPQGKFLNRERPDQVANYYRDGKILVDSVIWQHRLFGPVRQGAIVTHEAVYAYLRSQSEILQNSDAARSIVASLFSTLTINELRNALDRALKTVKPLWWQGFEKPTLAQNLGGINAVQPLSGNNYIVSAIDGKIHSVSAGKFVWSLSTNVRNLSGPANLTRWDDQTFISAGSWQGSGHGGLAILSLAGSPTVKEVALPSLSIIRGIARHQDHLYASLTDNSIKHHSLAKLTKDGQLIKSVALNTWGGRQLEILTNPADHQLYIVGTDSISGCLQIAKIDSDHLTAFDKKSYCKADSYAEPWAARFTKSGDLIVGGAHLFHRYERSRSQAFIARFDAQGLEVFYREWADRLNPDGIGNGKIHALVYDEHRDMIVAMTDNSPFPNLYTGNRGDAMFFDHQGRLLHAVTLNRINRFTTYTTPVDGFFSSDGKIFIGFGWTNFNRVDSRKPLSATAEERFASWFTIQL